MLVTSDRPMGMNPLIFAVCKGSTPDFSNLLAIRVRNGLGTSSLQFLDDARGPKEQILQINQLIVSQQSALLWRHMLHVIQNSRRCWWGNLMPTSDVQLFFGEPDVASP